MTEHFDPKETARRLEEDGYNLLHGDAESKYRGLCEELRGLTREQIREVEMWLKYDNENMNLMPRVSIEFNDDGSLSDLTFRPALFDFTGDYDQAGVCAGGVYRV